VGFAICNLQLATFSFLGSYGMRVNFASRGDWPGWQLIRFDSNMERNLVLHAEKIGLDGNI
jgi:hypothetical protein